MRADMVLSILSRLRSLLLILFFCESTQISCANLAGLIELRGAGVFSRSNLYLALVVSWIWRAFGISYESLLLLIAPLHAAYASAHFALARLFFPRALAIVSGIIGVISPIAISMMFLAGDYVKGPFILWAAVLLVIALRSTRAKAFLGWAALAGGIVGLGLGFRPDILIFIPIGVILLAFFSQRTFSLGYAATGVAAYTGAAVVMALPLLLQSAKNVTGYGVNLLAGTTDPFNRFLALSRRMDVLGRSCRSARCGPASL
jgi:hypothetical protein